jgi:S1-C subfamily serine protease
MTMWHAFSGQVRAHRASEFGGRKITGLDDFDLALRRFNSGDTIEITALRAGKPVKLKVTLGVPR